MSAQILPCILRPHNLPTCPHCHGVASYTAKEARVRCLTCGWSVGLTAQQNHELLDAVCGITELPIEQFLAEVTRTNEQAVA